MATPGELMVGALRPDLDALLRSHDAATLVDRATHLDPQGARPDDVERLDALLVETVLLRRSWRERMARLLTVLVVLALAVDATLLLMCSLEPELRRWVHLRRFTWPLTHDMQLTVGGIAAFAWLVGYAVVVLRASDAVGRARLACRVAAVHQPDTWPGLCVPAPCQRLGRRFTYPGVSLVLLAVGVLAARIAGWVHPGAVAWLVLSAGVVLGVFLMWLALPWRRGQSLALGTLFVERFD